MGTAFKLEASQLSAKHILTLQGCVPMSSADRLKETKRVKVMVVEQFVIMYFYTEHYFLLYKLIGFQSFKPCRSFHEVVKVDLK